MTVHTIQRDTDWQATDDHYPRVYGEGNTEQAAIEDLHWQILDDQDEHLRKNIAVGVSEGLCRVITIMTLAVLLGSAIVKLWPTDEMGIGMRLYTDAQTGCQYLATPGGSLTPRLSAMGEHICDQGGDQ